MFYILKQDPERTYAYLIRLNSDDPIYGYETREEAINAMNGLVGYTSSLRISSELVDEVSSDYEEHFVNNLNI